MKTITKTLLAVSVSVAAVMYVAPAMAVSDPVVLTFSTVGDSRQDPTSPDSTAVISGQIGSGTCAIPTGTGSNANPGLSGQDCKWLQNTAAWSRIMRTIQSQKANLLFFNGDMIMGYGKAGVPVTRNGSGSGETVITSPAVSDILNSDLMQFYQQYGFWRGMVANLIETGTYVVPVPGNHETQCKRCSKHAQVENEAAWRDNMGDLILDSRRLNAALAPTGLSLNATTWAAATAPGVADGLTTSQTQLSYSFDIGASHFAVINTDPVGKDGHAPTAWLSNDFSTALSNGAKHFFVFGHKPAYFYSYTGSATPGTTSSLYDADHTAGNTFWNLITTYNATYFSGHEHIYNVTQPNGGASYQVIVGAGGSPFEDSGKTGTAATDRLYSWATVSITQSGKVTMNTYGFDATLTNPVVKLGTYTLPNAQ